MKKIGLIFSEKDPASLNIKEQLLLLKEFKNEESLWVWGSLKYKLFLKTYSIDSVNITDLEDLSSMDYIIFPSKHQSKEGINSFSVHTPGNFTKDNSHGGIPLKVSRSWVEFQKIAYLQLKNYSDKMLVTPECTHHGPSIDIPCCYIEIGSQQKSWVNPEYGKVIAKTILKTLESVFNDEFNYMVGVGIGGPHYCSNFIKIYDSSNYAISHICPKYALLDISLETIKEAVLKSSIRPKIVFLDWKGLGEYKQKVRTIADELEKFGLKVIKTSTI